MERLRGSVTSIQKKMHTICKKNIVQLFLLGGLSLGSNVTQGQGHKGEEYSKSQTHDIFHELFSYNQDPEYMQLLEEIYINIEDPKVNFELKRMLYEKKELIKKLLNNKACKNFLQALHDEETKNPDIYLKQLDKLLPYDFNYIHEMSELYDRVQWLVYEENGVNEPLISNNLDKEFINGIITNVDHFVLRSFLNLNFLSSIKLDKMIQRQLKLIINDISNNKNMIIKEEDRAILGLEIARENPLIDNTIYQKTTIPFSSTNNSQCYISQTSAGAGTYLCSLQDNFLNYALKNNLFPYLEQHYFTHLDMNIKEDDLTHHFGKILEKVIGSSDKKEVIILINAFAHSKEQKNCTSDFFISPHHQGFDKQDDFGLIQGNSGILEKIAKKCPIINESTITYQGNKLLCLTYNGKKVEIYTSKTPIDTDGVNTEFSTNNTEGIGAIEILKNSIEKVQPTIIIATGQTETNLNHITSKNTRTSQTEIRIEGLGHKLPSKYWHNGIKNMNDDQIPEYFKDQGDNENMYRLLK